MKIKESIVPNARIKGLKRIKHKKIKIGKEAIKRLWRPNTNKKIKTGINSKYQRNPFRKSNKRV